MVDFGVDVCALFAGRGPPHEGGVGEGGPGLRFDQGGGDGGGGVVEGFLGVGEEEGEGGEEGGLGFGGGVVVDLVAEVEVGRSVGGGGWTVVA